jgi:hypothetical protein
MFDYQAADQQSPTQLGLHTISRERDLSIIRMQGPLSLDEAKAFHAMVEGSLQKYGTAYVMVDSTSGGALTPQTRRWIAEWNQRHHISGVAIYGSGLMMRTLLTLLLNAISLLRSHRIPSVFVKTEEEARVWLATLARSNSRA